MSDFHITDQDLRVACLNTIELGAVVFRGPDTDGWTALFEVGLPELMGHLPEGLGHLTDSLRRLQDSRPGLSETEPHAILETEYVRLFIAGAGGVVAPLYESCHLGDAPRIMGDPALSMRSRLGACGLEVALDSNEPPDHLSIELEYLYHLLATGWTEGKSDLEKQARDFSRMDMLPWVRRFREALSRGDAHPVYLAAADLVVTVLETVGG